MDGELTLLGETRPFGFDVEFHGVQQLPAELTGGALIRHAGFSINGSLKRSEFGLDFGMPASAGVLLGDKIQFELDLEFVEPGNG